FFTTKDPCRGTGLGLATVYGIVKQSGGHITVRSELGNGSEVKIYLPGESVVKPQASKTTLQAIQLGREHILVVEGGQHVRELACEILESSGYTVHACKNGREALQFCQAHGDALDMVLTDSIMPEMCGPELIARLGNTHVNLKVMLMSGYTDQGINARGEA